MLTISREQLEQLAKDINAIEVTTPFTGDKTKIAESKGKRNGIRTGIIFKMGDKIYYATGSMASAAIY